ncbi:hypothetical protein HELRODRAFT_176114 [Helobdella robusta]|uniref:Uncharacterized protein n=1 Tax=Helobdella robusta TaxID=6412 RepID=T1FA56_HELRO|nr:hypothetical protein HELRODRAFT_176114 [Helobdella robusta]ESO00256.1 hypothetical protein HELRODRAFT_176114 [Helobdella robusta]
MVVVLKCEVLVQQPFCGGTDWTDRHLFCRPLPTNHCNTPSQPWMSNLGFCQRSSLFRPTCSVVSFSGPEPSQTRVSLRSGFVLPAINKSTKPKSQPVAAPATTGSIQPTTQTTLTVVTTVTTGLICPPIQVVSQCRMGLSDGRQHQQALPSLPAPTLHFPKLNPPDSLTSFNLTVTA